MINLMARRPLDLIPLCVSLMAGWATLATLAEAQVPTPPPEFQLQLSLQLQPGAETPPGIRILRYPPKLDARVPAALIDSREVQFGSWRDWPADGSMTIKLKPDPSVAQYSWRVAAFERNDLHQFLVASSGFGEIPVGLSEAFAIDPAGGQAQIVIPIAPVIQIETAFGPAQLQAQSRLKYNFSYGPMGRPPREVVGFLEGSSGLPLKISPFALRREGVLKIQLQCQPEAVQLEPVEFALQSGKQKILLPELPAAGPLWVGFEPKLNLATAEPQNYLLKIGFEQADWGPKQLTLPGFSASSGLTLKTLRAGAFKFLAKGAEAFSPRYFASTSFDPADSPTKVLLQALPPAQAFDVSLPELDATDGPEWLVEVRGYWGPFFLSQSEVVEGRAHLMDLPDIRYLAIAKRRHPESGLSEIQLFLDGQRTAHQLSYRAHPTTLEVAGDDPQGEYTLRLMRGPDGPDFPPRQWQPSVYELDTVPYLPLPFRGKVLIRGLPDGNYEGSLWGNEAKDTIPVELEYLYFETH
jgi:hypothetical protein